MGRNGRSGVSAVCALGHRLIGHTKLPLNYPTQTIAMPCTRALFASPYPVFNQFRMLQPTFLPEREGMSILHLCLQPFIGSLSTIGSISKLFYLFLNCYTPSYISGLLEVHTPSRALRSADQLYLVIPPYRLKSRGDRAFTVMAPKLWNELPLHIRLAPSLAVFKSHLKIHFYDLTFNTA